MSFMEGDKEKGLSLIARAVENGYPLEPSMDFFSYLLNDPAYKQVVAGFELMRDEKRERFLNVVCHDNPYQSVWQPQEATCSDRS